MTELAKRYGGSLYDLADRRLERLGDYAQNAFRRSRKG